MNIIYYPIIICHIAFFRHKFYFRFIYYVDGGIMENNESTKITYVKNLTKQNFNLTISLPVDSNANIKTILNINPYIFDKKIECNSGKAIISGKIGLKVLYIDTDNIFNTLTDTQSFSETLLDNSITQESYIMFENENILCDILSQDNVLKLNCSISFNPILYMNIAIPTTETYEGLICKKCNVDTTYINKEVNTSFEYSCNFETKHNISKILCYRAEFIPDHIMASNDCVIVDGNIHSSLIYETNIDGQSVLKELCSTNMLKTDFSLNNMTNDQLLNLNFEIDQSKNSITTDLEDDNSVITVNHTIKVTGLAMQNISLELVDDMYSSSNELSVNLARREFCKDQIEDKNDSYIYGEIVLQENDTAVDSLISNTNINTEITNVYVKDETLFVEGITTSQLVYLDENHDYKTKACELPFVLDSKINVSELNCAKTNILVKDCKTKVKRGTIIEIEYAVTIKVANYTKKEIELVDNYTLGKPLDFSKYDYQIFLAHQNETIWELAKRINISIDELCSYNKNLPTIMLGNEKVIVKR